MEIKRNESGLTEKKPDKVEVSFETKSGKKTIFCKKRSPGRPAEPSGEHVNCPVCGQVHPVLTFKNTQNRNVRTWDCPKIGCKPVMRGKKAQKVIEDEWLVKTKPATPPVASHVREITPPTLADAKPAVEKASKQKPKVEVEPESDEWEIDDDLLKRWKELVE